MIFILVDLEIGSELFFDPSLLTSNKSDTPSKEQVSLMINRRNSLGGSLPNISLWQDTPGPDVNDTDSYIVKHSYSTDKAGELSISKGDILRVLRKSENREWAEVNLKGEIGWVPASCIVKQESLENYSWFHSNITRAEAEVCLSSGINGSFLVRESESKPGMFSLSLRLDAKCSHYLVHLDSTSKYHMNHTSRFESLAELIVHHSKDRDGLPTALRYPAPNPQKPIIDSVSHEVDEWELNRSEIETGQKLGEGRFTEHYKAIIKQRNTTATVKTFKVSYCT